MCVCPHSSFERDAEVDVELSAEFAESPKGAGEDFDAEIIESLQRQAVALSIRAATEAERKEAWMLFMALVALQLGFDVPGLWSRSLDSQ